MLDIPAPGAAALLEELHVGTKITPCARDIPAPRVGNRSRAERRDSPARETTREGHRFWDSCLTLLPSSAPALPPR